MDDYEEARNLIQYIINNHKKILKGIHPKCALCGRKGSKLHYVKEVDDVICDKCEKKIIN